MTITGSNLAGATAVHFGSVAGTIVSDTATQIVATSPPGSGIVNITVTTASGTSATLAADQFTFVAAPAVTGISPTSGPANGSTSVTITGSNLAGATPFHLAAWPARSSATRPLNCVVTSPPGSGTVDVTVTTADGTSTTLAADQFTFVARPL